MLKSLITLTIVWILTACNDNHHTESTILNLAFIPSVNNVNAQVIESNFDIIKEKTINGSRAILYMLNSESEIYGGVYINNKLYSIGPVSMKSTPDDLLSISGADVLGKNLIRFSGVLGANSAKTIYLEIEGDSIYPILGVDGNIVEIDLDNDNVKEVVTTIGTIPETSIYKMIDGLVSVANINTSIKAQAVSFHQENKKFEVYIEPNKQQYYFFSNGGLKQAS
jgi:hypothetical protein